MGDDSITRREALRRAGLLVAATTLVGCDRKQRVEGKSTRPRLDLQEDAMSRSRTPAIFLPHGGGPWPFLNEPLGPAGAWDRMEAYLKGLGRAPLEAPRALLVISAHWEEARPTVQAAARPPLLYDYSGFPPEAYTVQWPAPGAPELAAEILDLLEGAGLPGANDGERGFDHGVFVPLKLAYPGAEIPTLQLSLKRGLDPAEHLKIGRALQPLRERGVMLVGSGMSYHNLRGLMVALRGGPPPTEASRAFDEWLEATVKLEPDGRDTRLVEWERAPSARDCHPREEHLLPLHVIAGAAGDDPATLPYRDQVLGIHLSAVHFG